MTPYFPGPQNCWHMRDVTQTKSSEGRVFGWAGPHPPSPPPGPAPSPSGPALTLQLGDGVAAAGAPTHKSYAFGGASTEPGVFGDPFASVSATASVGNTKWYVPSYWGSEGYAVLAVASAAAPSSGGADSSALNEYQAAWSRNSGSQDPSTNASPFSNSDNQVSGGSVRWTFSGGSSGSNDTSSNRADLYLMPAATLAHGVSAMAALTGGAAVPPKYAFGFLACRWGWQNRSYIEATLNRFRSGVSEEPMFV